jgi:hypothetical protein
VKIMATTVLPGRWRVLWMMVAVRAAMGYQRQALNQPSSNGERRI